MFVLFSFSANAQIVDAYPKRQDFYDGGLQFTISLSMLENSKIAGNQQKYKKKK
jgi:hypothetical protein